MDATIKVKAETKKSPNVTKDEILKEFMSSKKVLLTDILNKHSITLRASDEKTITSEARAVIKILRTLEKSGVIKSNVVKGSRTIFEDRMYWKASMQDADGFNIIKIKQSDTRFDVVIGRVLTHMIGYDNKIARAGILFAGDPGGGKTSLTRLLAQLLGIELTIIEAPHVTDEHIINIPFVTIATDGSNSSKSLDLRVQKSESALITELKKSAILKLSDTKLSKKIGESPYLQQYYKKYEPLIRDVRSKYDKILFMDEFYRTGDHKIQNMLREVLNGRIGEARIPAGTDIIYASNMRDDGLDDIPLNHNNEAIEINSPSKDEFFAYLKNKYYDEALIVKKNIKGRKATSDEQIILDRPVLINDVFNQFHKGLEQYHFGANDATNEIRLSPRRLEQIIMYVNEARRYTTSGAQKNGAKWMKKQWNLVYNFVRTNLRNYLTNKNHKNINDIYDIIGKISNYGSSGTMLPPTKWKEEFEQQLTIKMLMGASRTQVTVVGGEPGIAKTLHIADVAKDLGMNMIHIGTQNLLKEDTIGIPLVDDKGIVHFSKPSLFSRIMDEYNNPEFPITTKGKYKHILFFDELNRTTKDVFNALRRVILDKTFNSVCKLPDDTLIVVALNPHDIGANELTTHIRDVMDFIEAEGSYHEIKNYIKNRKTFKLYNEQLGFDLGGVYLKILEDFLRNHSAKTNVSGNSIPPDQYPFYLNLNNSGCPVYLSPREIDYIIMHALNKSVCELIKMENYDPSVIYPDKEYVKYILILQKNLKDVFEGVLNSVFYKNEQNPSDVAVQMNSLAKLMKDNSEWFYGIKEEKQESIKTLQEICKIINYDFSKITKQHVLDFMTQRVLKDGEFQENIASIFEDIDALPIDDIAKMEKKTVLVISVVDLLKEIQKDGTKLNNKIIDDIVTFTHTTIYKNYINDKLIKNTGAESKGKDILSFFETLDAHPTINTALEKFVKLLNIKEKSEKDNS